MTESQLLESNILRDKILDVLEGSPESMGLVVLSKVIIDIVGSRVSKETYGQARKYIEKLGQAILLDFDFNYGHFTVN